MRGLFIAAALVVIVVIAWVSNPKATQVTLNAVNGTANSNSENAGVTTTMNGTTSTSIGSIPVSSASASKEGGNNATNAKPH